MYNYYPYYELRNNNPANWQVENNGYFPQNGQEYYPEAQDDRFFWAPFVVGGLAGTALGYGIANNNQINSNHYNGPYPQPMYFIPANQQPNCNCPYMYTSNSNNFYY